MTVFSKLSEDQQNMLLTVGSRALMDPWFISLASIPTLLNLVYLPHFVKLGFATAQVKLNYNNVSPRYTVWEEQLKNQTKVDFVKRCIGCHENTWEAFIAFAPAVILCKIQKADAATVKELCVKFLKLRFLYTIFYLSGQWRIVSLLRTTTWLGGMKVLADLYLTALLG